MTTQHKATASPDPLTSYHVIGSERWYDIEDINETYHQGIDHGRVEGVFYGVIIVCLVAIALIATQL